MSNNNISFKTDNLALCPFLELNGLKYLGREIGQGKGGNLKVFFVFEDEKGIGRDLEISFRFSQEKKYRDLGFFYRSEIEKAKIDLFKEKQKLKDKKDTNIEESTNGS